ncbi:uncharacterized protein LOC143856902 [Tasmannia lanceolata]|uniref:uncharacterized protein LOC143856902 n=1 Tax=Tasmannia lanceolata TaxID=3420 RepID=UPI004063C237
MGDCFSTPGNKSNEAQASEQRSSSTAHALTPAITTGLPVDTNLETSSHAPTPAIPTGETSDSKVDDPAQGCQEIFPGETSGSKVDDSALGRQQIFPGETSGSKVDDPALGHQQNFPGETTSGSKVDDPALGHQQIFPGETSGSKVDEPAEAADSQPTGETVSGMKPFLEFVEDEGLTRGWMSQTSSSVAGTSELPEIEPEKSVQPKNKEDVCCTCLEEYTKEKPGVIATCGHHFHAECFIAWRKKSETCPICAQEGIQPSLAMGDS